MLFRNFDQSHTAMRQHPVTTVAQRVRSVSKRDSADGTDDKCCRSHGKANSHSHKFSTTNSEIASTGLSHVVKDDNKGGIAKRNVNAEA